MKDISIWWQVKVLCALLLITAFVLRFTTDCVTARLDVDPILGSALVLVGGGVFLFHYALIKRKNTHLDKLEILISEQGLFRYIRHPMYFGESLMMAGYTLLAPNFITLSFSLWPLSRSSNNPESKMHSRPSSIPNSMRTGSIQRN